MRLVNQYIGVRSGYVGDFSYRSHADFYPEYCELEIDASEHQGTTRERFIKIISTLSPADQAKVVRGTLVRFPVGGDLAPSTRTTKLKEEFEAIARRIEVGALVDSPRPLITSAIVIRALADAEHLIVTTGPVSAVDRVHTSLHGYLRAACNAAGIAYAADATTTGLLKLLRRNDPRIRVAGARSDEIERVFNSIGNILDAMNTLRNHASVAHPNADLLGDDEARLVINAGRTVLTYLDAKLKPTRT